MAFGAHIQSVGKDSGSVASDPQAYGTNNIAGNILIAIVRVGNASANSVSSMTDTQTNTWVRGQSQVATADHDLEIWYALNCKVGANTVTANLTGTFTLRWIIAEYTGNGVSSAIDPSTNGNTGNSAALDSLSITTAKANTVLIGGNSMAADSLGLTATNSFTEEQEIVGRVQLQDRNLTATNTVNSTATAASASQWAASIIGINDGAGGGSASVVTPSSPSRRMVSWTRAAA